MDETSLHQFCTNEKPKTPFAPSLHQPKMIKTSENWGLFYNLGFLQADYIGRRERIEAGQQPGAHAHRVDVPGGDPHRPSPLPGEAAAGAAFSGAR